MSDVTHMMLDPRHSHFLACNNNMLGMIQGDEVGSGVVGDMNFHVHVRILCGS